MKAHELAHRLLAGPDLPVISGVGFLGGAIPEVKEVMVWDAAAEWRPEWGKSFSREPAVQLR